MSTKKTFMKSGPDGNGRVLPLEPGDRLTRDEFERRYEAMPNLKKAELIEGVVYMPSPVRVNRHGGPSRHLSGWLAYYEAYTPGVQGADNTTLRLDLENEPQPDGVLFILPECGGQVWISAEDFIETGPDLAAEVAASSASYDLNVKLPVFRRHHVQEYIVWRVLDKEIDWFVLRRGKYHAQRPDAEGLLRSEVFPGLWLDTVALVQGDLARVLEVVQAGTQTSEHRAFVARLQTQKKTPRKPRGKAHHRKK